MHILTLIVKNSISDNILMHSLCQSIPASKILPASRILHHSYAILFFNNSIVKANLITVIISVKKVLIILKVNKLMRLVKHISKFKCKNSAVPKSTFFNILLSRSSIRLFLKFKNLADISSFLGNNISVLLTWICRLYSHEIKVIFSLFCHI